MSRVDKALDCYSRSALLHLLIDISAGINTTETIDSDNNPDLQMSPQSTPILVRNQLVFFSNASLLTGSIYEDHVQKDGDEDEGDVLLTVVCFVSTLR